MDNPETQVTLGTKTQNKDKQKKKKHNTEKTTKMNNMDPTRTLEVNQGVSEQTWTSLKHWR